MKTTTANSYRITQFKKELWIDMSNACDSRFWSYSVSEKRLFLILVALLISLSLYYFNSYRDQDRIVREKVEQYASSNADTLKKLQTVTIKEQSPIPQNTDTTQQNKVRDKNSPQQENSSSVKGNSEVRESVTAPTPAATDSVKDKVLPTSTPEPLIELDVLDKLKLDESNINDVKKILPTNLSSVLETSLVDLEEVESLTDTLLDTSMVSESTENLIQLP